ncbi:TetR-like C-terminal domain-containing protein [Ornithinimicrobium sp. INDO-MA30-4]|uniref:TetR-like C-terminal domain-containing protein n=1 Tax=Ornithinimicrobium sp. INDO-MA30-4 TaxID=2908651 RepID=UPI001F249441|nr:TetR-like C-terminal domain-containing protein [Ornithinimicrobium sp. INDO-MA30-4]UJH69378.1 TetR/AcrR family transcriptional regulator C-terminal ligand-binding domain-containing protein [Ornithinimicrobium sp. INDO-MA30-4]
MLSGRIGATLVALVGESAHDRELAAIVRTSILEPTREHLEAIFDRAAARGEAVEPMPHPRRTWSWGRSWPASLSRKAQDTTTFCRAAT